jgi:hypothetical protein
MRGPASWLPKWIQQNKSTNPSLWRLRARTDYEQVLAPVTPIALPCGLPSGRKGGAAAHSLRRCAAREGSVARVRVEGREGDITMSYPGPGPIYRHCIVCGRPFRVWRCELLRNRAKFCTRKCYFASRRLFSIALADGRLERILANELERTRAESREPPCRSFSNYA